jgi:pimeloyl-ACP methyl ester carboxylesterase
MSRRRDFTLPGGQCLAADAWGDPAHPPVILSHGGGQTRHAWGGTAAALAGRGWYAVAYDHRGHGDSSWAADGDYDIGRFAEDQRCLARAFTQRPALVGASLGGISAMLAEGESTEPVFSAVVLVDIVPRMNQDGARNVLRFMGTHVKEGFASLEEAADVIAEYTGRPRRRDISGLAKNLRLREDGRYYWHWDPRFIHQRHENLTDPERLVRACQRIDVPMMLVRGQMSELVTPALAEDFLNLVPHARYVDVADARHMVAGDRNDVFTDAVIDFLRALHPGSKRAS